MIYDVLCYHFLSIEAIYKYKYKYHWCVMDRPLQSIRHTMKQKLTAVSNLVGIRLIAVLLLLASLVAPIECTEIKYEGDENLSHIVSPLPYTYLEESSLPKSFDWNRVDDGKRSMLTHMINQHIPQVNDYRL